MTQRDFRAELANDKSFWALSGPVVCRISKIVHEASSELDRFRAEVMRLEEELNRQKAKTEYEAERAGNVENDLDRLRTLNAELVEALMSFGCRCKEKCMETCTDATDHCDRFVAARVLAKAKETSNA